MLERFNVNGSVDTTFGVKGVAATPYADYQGGAISVDSSGRIVVAGGSTAYLSVTRYNPNGTLDTSFGTDGSTTTGPVMTGLVFNSTAMTLQSSGRIVVVGNNQPPEALITRFLGNHVTLTAGTSAVTTGTTNVADPRLLGHVIASQTLNFTFGSGLSAVTGQLQEWVEKETVSGTLDFYIRIVTDSGSAAGISSLLASGFSGFQTYVDYRPDSSGTIAPVTASRSTDDRSIVFNFLPGPSGGGLVTAGKSSYALFIKTDATHFNKLGKVVLNNTIDLSGFEPIG